MEQVPEIVIRISQIFGLTEDDLEVVAQIALV
jgi:hypothetical protein